MTLTFGSLFAGIGGFDVALERCGFRCAWQVEVDPQAVRVLDRHYPNMPRLADVKDCGKKNLAPVDVICGGTPCQDLSMAGKRKGLKGERSGLFFEYIRILRELRPAFAVWENVPGAFSSNSGRDFLAILCAFRKLRARDLAWRSLDARYCGLAQQRERVFIVADFRGERAGQILFESSCGCRNPPASGQAKKNTASALRSRSAVGRGVSKPGRGGEDDVNLVSFNYQSGGNQDHLSIRNDAVSALGTTQTPAVCGPLMAHSREHGHAMGTQQAAESGQLIAHAVTCHAAKSGDPSTDNFVVGALGSAQGGPDDNDAQVNRLVVYEAAVSGCMQHKGLSASGNEAGTLVAATLNSGGNSGGFRTEPGEHLIAHALTSSGHDASEDGTGRGTPIVPIDMRQASRGATMTNNRRQGTSGGAPGTGIGEDGDPSPTIAQTHVPAVGGAFGVRRLTPLECTRLMGFPDDYLDLDPPLSDSAKYRLLGNAVCPPVVESFAPMMAVLLQNAEVA